jgi:hypothetical protein
MSCAGADDTEVRDERQTLAMKWQGCIDRLPDNTLRSLRELAGWICSKAEATNPNLVGDGAHRLDLQQASTRLSSTCPPANLKVKPMKLLQCWQFSLHPQT